MILIFHAVFYLISQINLIAPPLYVMTTQTLERAEGLAKLGGALGKIKDLIEEAGGVFNVKQQVHNERNLFKRDTFNIDEPLSVQFLSFS